MKGMCFSFQSSGHKFKGLKDLPDGPIVRLFCPRCGRVVPANQDYNTEAWVTVKLPEWSSRETGNPNEPIH